MNIEKNLIFNDLKPAILSLRKTEKINIFSVGLKQNQILVKHKTASPTLLTVLKGEILFRIQGEDIRLLSLDTFEIPVNVEHEVMGVTEENIFMLIQEKG